MQYDKGFEDARWQSLTLVAALLLSRPASREHLGGLMDALLGMRPSRAADAPPGLAPPPRETPPWPPR